MDHEIQMGGSIPIDRPESVSDDAEISGALRAGDQSAWAEFNHRFFRWTYRFSYYHLSRSHADAEDLTSEILLTAVRNIGKFDATKGDLDAWLLGIAKRSLGHYCRRRHWEIPTVPDLIAAQQDASAPSEDLMVDRALLSNAVNLALCSLPARQSAVLLEKYVVGYSTEELARIADTSPKAIESLLGRARASFKAVFARLIGNAERGDMK